MALCSASAILAFYAVGALVTQQTLPVQHMDPWFYYGFLAFCVYVGLVCMGWTAQLAHAPKPPRIVQLPPLPAPAPKVVVKERVKVVRKVKLPEEDETDVYRLFDAEKRLLYVGIAANVKSRWWVHSREKPWWGDVVRADVRRYQYRYQALAVEHAAIMYERPRYNKARGRLRDSGFQDGWIAPRRVDGLRLPPPQPRITEEPNTSDQDS